MDQRFHDEKAVFLHFVLSHYIDLGVGELDREKLAPLLRLKYGDSIQDASAGRAGEDFRQFQRHLYEEESA